MAIVVGETHQVTFWCQLDDQAGLIVRHYYCGAVTGGSVTEQEWADAMSTLFAPLFKPLLTAGATYDGLTTQRILPLPKLLRWASIAGAGVGTAGGNAMPRQTCGVIGLKTQYSGRSYRGRAFVPFPDEAHNDDYKPNAAYTALLTLLAAELDDQQTIVGAGGTATLSPMIFSKKLGQVNTIIAAFPRTRWGTQRRRGSYGGSNLPLLA